jgi:cell division FtsZ-interacting protein ZapD
MAAKPNIRPIKTHTFRDRLFRMIWRRPAPKDEGQCDYDNRAISIHPNSDAKELLLTVIHESFHACFFDIDNGIVDDYERDLDRLLTRMGIEVSFNPKIKR